MAVSISASSTITLSSLNSCTRVGASSSSLQLQFPLRTRFLPIGTRRLPASSRPRFLNFFLASLALFWNRLHLNKSNLLIQFHLD
ncbi:hypothetical protein KIW84_065177 [Lathyrus oleraceus]|uniref:Uncharacterized protein n=1 Tax=Pisum sativum TaxID=3888 RepID=A0A9D4WC84_PEA|nr:hypothetical protein KIW84_065177 [Pisum sativum]